MIDKLEAGKTYRLINKEGYLGDTSGQRERIYNECFIDDCITLDEVTLWGSGEVCGEPDFFVIVTCEYEYFELVQEHSSLPNYTPCDTLTRCQELAAEYNDSRFTVEYKQQVLESLIQLLTTGENK